MYVFSIQDELDKILQTKRLYKMPTIAANIVKSYGHLDKKINFVQNLRSAEDAVYKHALNTAILCALISKQLKLEFKKQLDVVVAGILYDIGELLVPLSLRKMKSSEMDDETRDKIYTYRIAGYQLLNKFYDLDPNVRRTATLGCKELYQLSSDEEEAVDIKVQEVEILKVAAVFDNMTAMKYEEEPLSEISALRYLQDKKNGFDQDVVVGLVNSINILNPGVCVELSNGDRGLVIAEGPLDILKPFVLSFKDNQVLNLADDRVSSEIQIVDIMKTMDNRHVVNSDLLATYQGNGLAMGQKRDKKHF